MPEEEFKTDNLKTTDEKPESEYQVDDFPETRKLLDKVLADKKDNIQKVLGTKELKELFEEALSDKDIKKKLCGELMSCLNDETEIKKVILANLPEGYVYNVSTNEVVKVEVKKTENFTGATTTDRKGEQAQADIDQAQAKGEQAQADMDQAQASIEGDNNSKEHREAVEKMNLALDERSKLTERYTNLNSLTNENSDNYQNVKFQLEENGVLNQLKESGYDDKFINNYVLVQTTLQELKLNHSNYDQNDISYFDKIVKSLNNSCNISDTKLNSFSQENISETRRDLFDKDIGNEDLRKTKQKNLDTREYPKGVFDMSDEDIIVQYGKFLPNEHKRLLEDYVRQYNQKNLEEYKQSREYNLLLDSTKKIKEEMDKKTKELMEELCIMSQIKGMYMCMGEGANFDLNKANEIEIEQNEEEKILTLKGHIDGIDFSLRQDINDPNARLKTSTKMVNDRINNRILIGDNFQDSNFILPSQDKIFDIVVKSVMEDGALNMANTQEEYENLLQEKIMKRVDKMYENTKYVHNYMKEQVKGEKIIDNTIKTVEKIKGSNLSSTVNNVGLNKKLYDFFSLIDFNVRNSSAAEKNKLDDIMNKVKDITSSSMDKPDNPEFNKYRPIIKDHLTGNALQNISENLNGHASDGKTMFDLFQLYKKPGDGELRMINIDYLHHDLFTPINPAQPSIIEGSPVSLGYEEQKEIIEQDTADARLGETIERNIT